MGHGCVKPVISAKIVANVVFCDVDLLDRNSADRLPIFLEAAEQKRNERFLVEKARRLHAAAHVLARLVLADHLQLPPERLHFARTATGKPFLADPPAPVAVSLAHSGSLALCAFAPVEALGIDVEPLDRREFTPSLLHDLLAPVERARLVGLEGTVLQEALVALWTGKEAVAKAHGGGLSLPLERLIVPPGDGAVDMGGIEGAAPAVWRLHRLRPDPRYRAALALALAPEALLEIRCTDATNRLKELPARPPAAGSA
ncbi:4'-phosphopantetheinyl transferase family protein [Geminicoccus roseus]|uniref:4'-phosphopantetheinyl transferase family protein n=1 Tax=Geminicoccus roseus TaxID=404900 RepID=UPI0038995887